MSRCRNLDRNYFKRWLLRETPGERLDIKLLQTFKRIDTHTAMKVHDAAKGLVPVPSTLTMQMSPSTANLRPENTFSNIAQLMAATYDLHCDSS